MRKNIVIPSILILTVLLTTIPSYAASFSDVPAGSTYADSIGKMSNMKIIGGVGEGNFAPDRKVTGYEFSVMLTRLYGDKAKALPDEYQQKLEAGEITWKDASEIALYIAGIQCSPDIISEYPIYQNSAMNTAEIRGLYRDAQPEEDQTMTRAECTDFLYMLAAAGKDLPSNPLALFDNVVIEDADQVQGLYSQVATDAEKLPYQFVQTFNNEGFSLVLSNSPSKYIDMAIPSGSYIGGLTWYSKSEKKLFLFPVPDTETSSLYHELGHVLSFIFGIRNDGTLANIWKNDAGNIIKLTGQRAAANSDECWAEAFKYMLININDAEKMTEAERLIPTTYRVFMTLLGPSYGPDLAAR